MQYICHNHFTKGGSNSHSAQRRILNYASFYPLCVVQVQREECEKLGSLPEKCSKLYYWILYYAVRLFRDILSDDISVLQCYCVWLKGSNKRDPHSDSLSFTKCSLFRAKGERRPVAPLLILATMTGGGWPWECTASKHYSDKAAQVNTYGNLSSSPLDTNR